MRMLEMSRPLIVWSKIIGPADMRNMIVTPAVSRLLISWLQTAATTSKPACIKMAAPSANERHGAPKNLAQH